MVLRVCMCVCVYTCVCVCVCVCVWVPFYLEALRSFGLFLEIASYSFS